MQAAIVPAIHGKWEVKEALYSVFDGLTTTSFFSSFDCLDGSSSSLVDDLDGSVAGSLATSLSSSVLINMYNYKVFKLNKKFHLVQESL
jgi:hypothetical protein